MIVTITYKLKGKIYHDSVVVGIETTCKEVRDMFEMNHVMCGDLNECKIVSVEKCFC